MTAWNTDMNEAPKDGTKVLLWDRCARIGFYDEDDRCWQCAYSDRYPIIVPAAWARLTSPVTDSPVNDKTGGNGE